MYIGLSEQKPHQFERAGRWGHVKCVLWHRAVGVGHFITWARPAGNSGWILLAQFLGNCSQNVPWKMGEVEKTCSNPIATSGCYFRFCTQCFKSHVRMIFKEKCKNYALREEKKKKDWWVKLHFASHPWATDLTSHEIYSTEFSVRSLCQKVPWWH